MSQSNKFSRIRYIPDIDTQVCDRVYIILNKYSTVLYLNYSKSHVVYHFLKKVLISQACPTLRDPMDCSASSSSLHGILQARILECVAIPVSRGIFPTRVFCIAGRSLPSEMSGRPTTFCFPISWFLHHFHPPTQKSVCLLWVLPWKTFLYQYMT